MMRKLRPLLTMSRKKVKAGCGRQLENSAGSAAVAGRRAARCSSSPRTIGALPPGRPDEPAPDNVRALPRCHDNPSILYPTPYSDGQPPRWPPAEVIGAQAVAIVAVQLMMSSRR